MQDYPGYASRYITVSFDGEVASCDPNPLDIPANTIATITWVPATGSDFLFLTFEWIDSNGFLSQDPIIHDHCIIAVVNNTQKDALGEWPYVLKIQVDGRVYQTGSFDEIEDGKPIIHNQ
jgi:hypothetical protein